MARTELTVTTLLDPFDIPTANEVDITWAAADVANGNYFTCTGREILLVWNNGGGSAYYVTITSVDDEKQRSENVTEYDVGINEVAAFTQGATNSRGWKQTNGQVYIDGENADLDFAVLRLPAGIGR